MSDTHVTAPTQYIEVDGDRAGQSPVDRAADEVAGAADVLRLVALCEQPSVGGLDVVELCRAGVFGGMAEVHDERADPGGLAVRMHGGGD